jgi:benzoylformate decarboxylase
MDGKSRTGRFAIIEQFLTDGIHYMFGNPGTVEQGFLDALEAYPDFKYILTLQESIAVGIGDGYARATRKPTIVQLHSGVGLGNGIGMMYQAMRGQSPLVIIASEAGIRYDAMDSQMAADLVSMARSVTKWSTRVVHSESVLRVLRKAIKIAATPPMGPVFVCLPMDVLDAPNTEPVVPTSFPVTRVSPDDSIIDQATALLKDAKKPLIIMGDGIAFSDAQKELVRIAELLGAEVWGANSSEFNIPERHPLYKGQLGHMFGSSSSKITAQADAVLICGTYVFPEVFPALEAVFAPDAKVVHIDLNLYEIAKNFPVTLGVLGDPKLTLNCLAESLATQMTAQQKDAARVRADQIGEAKHQAHIGQLAKDESIRDDVPLHASRFITDLAAYLPKDAIIFDEALTCSPELTRYLPPSLPGHFFQTRGGSLGVGIPGALGLKLANPDKMVIGFTGDGGSMYTIQALWTAAHHNIGAKFVICNNQSYMLLKLNILQYWRERGIQEHDFPASFDLLNPVVDFAALSQSMGVPAVRVEKPDEIQPAIEQMLVHNGPFLIDLVVSNDVPGTSIAVPAQMNKAL